MAKTVDFIDAQKMHKQHKTSFNAPNNKELGSLKVGDIVKVCVNNKERFWAEIKVVEGETIRAIVDNDLVYADEFGFDDGDEIIFEKRHIYSIFNE